jgi:hypothetical protein
MSKDIQSQLYRELVELEKYMSMQDFDRKVYNALIKKRDELHKKWLFIKTMKKEIGKIKTEERKEMLKDGQENTR